MSIAELSQYEMLVPRSLAEACRLAETGEAVQLIAGTTDLLVEWEMAPSSGRPKPRLIDISRLSELRNVELRGGEVFVGAGATFRELCKSALLETWAPCLLQAARQVGAIQIQARGTLGGNLATQSPAADAVTALYALEADVLLRSSSGERRVPIGAYATGYKTNVRARGEIIEGFFLPRALRGYQLFQKVGTRAAQAISKVALAGAARIEDGVVMEIGFGMASVGPITASLAATARHMSGQPIGALDAQALADVARAELSPRDDVRSTAEYRRHLAGVLVQRFVEGLKAAR